MNMKLQLTYINPTLSFTFQVCFGFADPSTLEGHPGWPLRNYLMLIAYHYGNDGTADVLCFRDRSKDGVRDISHSLLLSVNLPQITDLTGTVIEEIFAWGNFRVFHAFVFFAKITPTQT